MVSPIVPTAKVVMRRRTDYRLHLAARTVFLRHGDGSVDVGEEGQWYRERRRR